MARPLTQERLEQLKELHHEEWEDTNPHEVLLLALELTKASIGKRWRSNSWGYWCKLCENNSLYFNSIRAIKHSEDCFYRKTGE